MASAAGTVTRTPPRPDREPAAELGPQLLARERARASFDVHALGSYLQGGQEAVAARAKAAALLEAKPACARARGSSWQQSAGQPRRARPGENTSLRSSSSNFAKSTNGARMVLVAEF